MPAWGVIAVVVAAAWGAMLALHAHGGGDWTVVALWAVMVVAMMLPTAAPMLRAFADVAGTTAGPSAALLTFVAGYAVVWLGFSAVASTGQLALRDGVLDSTGVVQSPWLAAAVLGVAAVYQVTPLQQACAARCRSPIAFLLARWHLGPLRLGVRHGADCLGCCWHVMALAFLAGLGSAWYMTVALVVMAVEKLPMGAALGRVVAAALAIAAVAVAIGALAA